MVPAVTAPAAGASIEALRPAAKADAPFSKLFRGAVEQVGQLQEQAATTVEGLLRGDGIDVHQAMIATQKADLAFELAVAVRNKAVAAYQSMMSMQF